MNIYEFAMKMEKDGEELYRGMAAKTKQAGLKKIFELLAHEEAKHHKAIQAMSRDSESIQSVESNLFDNVKSIFEQIKNQETDFEFHATAADVYRDALDLEKQSIQFYQGKADEMDDPGKKNILLELVKEEKKHELVVKGLIEYITRPETWLEDAEWNHFDEY